MSDPDERLSSFDPGPAMNPLPPADVRRRGDRLRRRNNVIAGVGAAVAVAVIVTPLAILGSRGDDNASPDPAPAPPSPSVTTDGDTGRAVQVTIPGGFPLGDGMALDPAIDPVVSGDRGSAELIQASLNICGQDSWARKGTTDLLGATWSDGIEGGEQRTLAVYSSDAEAESALRRIADDVGSCPDGGGTGYPVVALDSELGEESTAYVEQYPQDDDGRSFQVSRVGNALLIDHTYVPAGGDVAAAQSAVDDLATRAGYVVAAMCVFAADQCVAVEESPVTPEGSVAIPDDFPLAAGWPDDADAEPGPDSGLTGPNDSLGAFEHTACGSTAPTPEAGGVLRASWSNPEDYRFRELYVFPDTAAAVSYVEDLAGFYSGCPVEDTGDGFTTLREVRETGVSGHSYAVIQSSQYDGAPAIGLQLTQLIRVGRSVLIDNAANEGTADSSRTQIEEQADRSAEVVAAMCLFTEAGCS